MPILTTLNKERFGTWTTLLAYLQDLNRRESGSMAALAVALTAPAEEQRELAAGEGLLVLADVAGDLRVQKGARLAAVRCCIEAGASGPPLATLFIGGGELATDPRLGATAKKLVETGLPEALAHPGHEITRVSLAAGAFAKAVQASSSVVGQVRLKELLAAAPPAHAGVNAGLFALGQQQLAAAELDRWKTLLRDACAANKRAPAAAKRIGLAPPWPPNLPDAFKDLIADAEKATATVVSIDATKGGVISGRAGPPPPAPKGRPLPVPNAPPIQSRAPSSPRAGSIGAPLLAGARSSVVPPQPAASAPAAPEPAASTASAAKKQEAIRRSPFRRPIGTVQEGPFVTAPRQMPAVGPQASPGAQAETKLAVAETKAAATLAAAEKGSSSATLPGLAALATLTPVEKTQFDAHGKRLPRGDRFRGDDWGWAEPILPPSELKPIPKARTLPGPFAARLRSLFDDKPEAVDRLCAAAEARAAIAGAALLDQDLAAELARAQWKDLRVPKGQLARLETIAADAGRPQPWRSAAALLLQRLPKAE